jgi:DNA polymerase V
LTVVLRFVPAAPAPLRVFCPLMTVGVSAGFPSPADDHIDRMIDLNEKLIRHPPATFFVRVSGDSMIDAGIHSGDTLIVDRALEPRDGQIIVAALDGQYTVKRLKRDGGRVLLVPENACYKPIEVTPERGFEVWGVVTCVIRSLCRF